MYQCGKQCSVHQTNYQHVQLHMLYLYNVVIIEEKYEF